MKTIVKSKLFRESMIFAGLLAVALMLSALIGDMSFAATDDSIPFINDRTGGEGDIKALAKTIINFGLGFLGFVAVVMVIYGGVLYVVSAGNDEQVGKAKKIILYAVVGIIVIFASYALVNTILGAATPDAAT